MDKTKEQSQDKRWTDEQIQAIEDKGANLLISAAAGSGKTTVLIERIVRKILNDGVNVDDLLVVTFTNAAASEMKERLLKALYQKLDENPDDENLQKQISLINRAHISTIHSFCLDIIRNNFFETSLPANFRIADDSENEIIKQEAMERVFEDISWLIEKFEYQNRDADWKNSKDAVGRGMQKLRGSYPQDPPYTMKK